MKINVYIETPALYISIKRLQCFFCTLPSINPSLVIRSCCRLAIFLSPISVFEPPGGSKLVITRKTSNSKSICLVPHHASGIDSSVFVFPPHLMSNTHIVYAFLPYVALPFNNVFFTLRHRPPPVFPMSHPSSNQHLNPFPLRALIPFHVFLIDTYFSGRQLRPGSKNTSTQVQQSNAVVVFAVM